MSKTKSPGTVTVLWTPLRRQIRETPAGAGSRKDHIHTTFMEDEKPRYSGLVRRTVPDCRDQFRP
jgi:hypothetical protein